MAATGRKTRRWRTHHAHCFLLARKRNLEPDTWYEFRVRRSAVSESRMSAVFAAHDVDFRKTRPGAAHRSQAQAVAAAVAAAERASVKGWPAAARASKRR